MEPAEAWNALSPPWQAALEEAWASWVAGSAGVGAVVTDDDGHIRARGRNRMLEEVDAPGTLAGTALAHAEMNALAQLSLGSTAGLTLYTTFEPCLMCASAIIQCRIDRVHYAAADPVFDGLHDWFGEFPFSAERLPEREFLGGPFGAFAHLLHLSWISFWFSDGPIVESHRRLSPRHLELATSIVSGRLQAVAATAGDVLAAATALWPELGSLS